MKAIKLQLANKTLLNPAAPQWERAPSVHLALRGTEAVAQPTAYIRTAWAGRRIGSVRSLTARAAHNRLSMFFRLEWSDQTPNTDYGDGTTFPDAAAVLFPENGKAPIGLMGTPAEGIRAWYWRANHPKGESLRFSGLASEVPDRDCSVHTAARWSEGRWSVVFSAPLDAGDHGPSVGFAVWEGNSRERAGLHSYTPEWQDLEVE